MEIVKAVIKPDGSLVIETSGFVGEACDDLVDSLLAELGDIAERQHTAEYARAKEQRHGTRQQQRG